MTPSSALAGITVLEICNVAAGPFCGMLLADMGADVIKVENPEGGDTLRSWPPISDGYSENFASLNRNKRSVTLNLKDPGDLTLARELALTVDVLIENNRPGVMDRLGLGYAQLREANPKLVYCSISAYGQSGPRSQEGGFDLTIQAMSGIMSVTGEAGGEPVKCGVPLADFSAGLYGAFAIASALRAAQASGQGTHIDVPMLGATLGIAALQTSEYFGSGKDPVKLGSAHPRNAPYQAFRCKGGYFGMAAGNQALWKGVCATVGREDLLADPRFTDTSARARNQAALRDILEAIFEAEDAQTWLARFRAAGVPCAPINTYSEVLADPQVEHMGWVQPVELPNGVRTRTFGLPVRFDGQTTALRRRPPALGEHNDEVLGALRAARKETAWSDVLRIDRQGAAHVLTLARPDKMNALSADLVEALIAALDQAEAADASLIVLKGEGRNFSAGFDFGNWQEQSEGDLLLRFVRIETLLQRLAASPCLTLGLAHGRNFGAGVDLLGACKWRVSAPDATFRMPGLKFGLVLGTRRYAALVGVERARTVLEQAATFTAEEALRDGFASRLAAPQDWPQIEREALDAASALSRESRVQLYAALSAETPDTDLARLVRSAAQPGLKDRVAAYLQAR